MNKKRKIVLASLLKPVDDPRMYEKFALSMAQTNKYAINIIGFSAKNIPSHPSIRFFPVFRFRRLSLKRLLTPLQYGRILLKVKPELIIVTSHDLLIVSCVYKILFGCKIAYDVQENYQQNIIWSSDLPSLFRFPLAYLIRLKEKLVKRMIIHFFVAEKCYLNECSFIHPFFTVLENKERQSVRGSAGKVGGSAKNISKQRGAVQLIYSGTIAETYGIFDSIALADQWISTGVKLRLHIIGYCPREDTFQKLVKMIRERPYIQLTGGNEPVPHPLILKALQEADFSLISYHLNPSNQYCMPTRIWECLAFRLPMIMKPDHPWLHLLGKFDAGFAVDYQCPAPQSPEKLQHTYYQSTPLPDSFYWEWEEKKLLDALESLF